MESHGLTYSLAARNPFRPCRPRSGAVHIPACCGSAPSRSRGISCPITCSSHSSNPLCVPSGPADLSHNPSACSRMLGTANNIPANLRPINTRIQLLVNQPTHHHVVSPHQIQAMRLLRASLIVVLRPYHALDRVFQAEVRDLVAGDQRAG